MTHCATGFGFCCLFFTGGHVIRVLRMTSCDAGIPGVISVRWRRALPGHARRRGRGARRRCAYPGGGDVVRARNACAQGRARCSLVATIVGRCAEVHLPVAHPDHAIHLCAQFARTRRSTVPGSRALRRHRCRIHATLTFTHVPRFAVEPERCCGTGL